MYDARYINEVNRVPMGPEFGVFINQDLESPKTGHRCRKSWKVL